MTSLTPVLSRFWDEPEPWSLETYRRHDGYRALERALAMAPDDLIATIKDSGLRGRGGAGFPTGTKWSFIPQDATGAGAKPKYLVVNADESEPGTCKDIPLMLTTPHFLVEGVIIAAYAIRAHHAFIFMHIIFCFLRTCTGNFIYCIVRRKIGIITIGGLSDFMYTCPHIHGGIRFQHFVQN